MPFCNPRSGQIIVANIATEAMTYGHNENRTDNVRTIVVFQVDASCTDVPKDEENI